MNWGSARGVFALITVSFLFLLLGFTIIGGLMEFFEPSGQEIKLDAQTLYLLAFTNFLLFGGLPSLFLALAYPARRLHEKLALVDKRAGLHILLGIAVTFAALIVYSAIAYFLVESKTLAPEESQFIQKIAAVLRSHPELILILSLTAGIGEEILFRGFLQPRVGVIASNVLFGLVHASYGTVLQLVVPALLGLLLGYLYRRTGSLWAPIAGHTFFDLLQLSLLYFLPETEEPASSAIIGFL